MDGKMDGERVMCVVLYIPLGAAWCVFEHLIYSCHPPVSLPLEFSAPAVVFLRGVQPLQGIKKHTHGGERLIHRLNVEMEVTYFSAPGSSRSNPLAMPRDLPA